jgi:hypothetical protein
MANPNPLPHNLLQVYCTDHLLPWWGPVHAVGAKTQAKTSTDFYGFYNHSRPHNAKQHLPTWKIFGRGR